MGIKTEKGPAAAMQIDQCRKRAGARGVDAGAQLTDNPVDRAVKGWATLCPGRAHRFGELAPGFDIEGLKGRKLPIGGGYAIDKGDQLRVEPFGKPGVGIGTVLH